MKYGGRSAEWWLTDHTLRTAPRDAVRAALYDALLEIRRLGHLIRTNREYEKLGTLRRTVAERDDLKRELRDAAKR